MPGATRCSALLKTRLDRFTRVLPGIDKGDVRALHRARVASRRLREIVPVLQLDADATGKLNRRLRRVTRRLGAVRELDVLLLLVDELRHANPAHTDALTRVGAVITKTRDESRKELADRLPVDDLERVARKLEHVVDSLRRTRRSVATAGPASRRTRRGRSMRGSRGAPSASAKRWPIRRPSICPSGCTAFGLRRRSCATRSNFLARWGSPNARRRCAR